LQLCEGDDCYSTLKKHTFARAEPKWLMLSTCKLIGRSAAQQGGKGTAGDVYLMTGPARAHDAALGRGQVKLGLARTQPTDGKLQRMPPCRHVVLLRQRRCLVRERLELCCEGRLDAVQAEQTWAAAAFGGEKGIRCQ